MDPFLISFIFVAVFLGSLYLSFQTSLKMDKHIQILEDALEIPGYGLVFFDRHDRFYSANERALQFLPFLEDVLHAKGRARGMSLAKFINYMYDHAAEDEERLEGLISKSQALIRSQGFREIISSGGRLCLAEVHKTFRRRHVLVIQDLSMLKNEEDQIIRLNHYGHELTQAVEATTNGIVITRHKDGAHQIVFANKAFYDQTQMSLDAVLGADLQNVMSRLADTGEAARISKALEEKKNIDFEMSLGEGDQKKWVNLKLTPVKDHAGQLDLFIAVLTDITELKMRELDIFRTQKLEALGQLAAGVAHDFNNILSIIDGYARIAAGKPAVSPQIREYLKKIQNAGARGAGLTSQLLTFSRHKIVANTVIDLSRSIKEQAILMQPLLDASVDLSVVVEEEDIAIEVPADHITQMVMNLAINGRDAMPDGGYLLIGLYRCAAEDLPSAVRAEVGAQDMACIYVSDTGHGMTKDTRDKLFDPFFTTKAQGKGTGLGLFMVYGLVKQAGGYIDVQSDVGEGTTVSIFLPVSEKDIERKIIEGSADDASSISMKGYTALVAEDEPDLLLIMTNLLQEMGMHTIAATNGDEALLKQEEYEGEIDLLLTDVVMPQMDGVKLAELFKSLRPDTNVIFMSGYPANKNAMRVDLPKDAVFMAKPVKYEALAGLAYKMLVPGNNQAVRSGGGHDGALPHWESSDVIDNNVRNTKEVM